MVTQIDAQGDFLCWETGQLEVYHQSEDRTVHAVADEFGKPIVLGAEVVKVLGPVRNGDLLVASNIPGYAIAENEPLPGTEHAPFGLW